MCHNRLKPRSVFLIGFGIGFFLALLLLLAQNLHYAYHRTPGHSSRNNLLGWFLSSTNTETLFQTWKQSDNTTYNELLKDKGLKSRELDLDSYLYGPKSETELEADWLKSQVDITCVVFVKKIKLAKAIRDTWGKRCNRIYFFGRKKDSDVPVISFDVKLTSSWQLLCEAFTYIWRDKPRLQWLLFVKDETLVIPENLRYMLAPLNHTQDYYLGHAVVLWGQAYNVADAGYVISAPVLRKLIKKFDSSEKCLVGGKYWKQEDYYLAKHLASMGIHPSDTRDQYLRGTFHGYSLQSLLWGVVKTGVYWNRALYPIEKECCSFTSITFNVAEPDKMRTFNYLLYHFHVLNMKAAFGRKQAARIVPEEDVWKIALKDEFNITYLQDISSDAYYKIWHAKYSEPEQLINMNYRSKDNN
ncbi:C1GALT1-specific chaperone 1-like protein [Ceratina calcarata]|uniref:C1GALT1-specific chaperone 1-like protein n=1 Tax=Ceratina calcarata TaxID=156304 RepID=A0AAJ7IUA2_9HYME|nr:C1GALT1-specific chaperone 1-like protein [Ceratina calcarata]